MKDLECKVTLFENAERSQLIDNFFKQRLTLISENKYPTTLSADPACRFIMYIIPEKFYETHLDIKALDEPEEYLIPLGEAKNTVFSDFNFDGIVFLSSVHVKHAYTQVFRDGKIETVVAITRFGSDSHELLLPLIKLQKNLPEYIHKHIKMLDHHDVHGPYHLYISLIATEGLRIDHRDIAIAGYDVKGRNKALIKNSLDFPIHTFEHANVDVDECLRPFFDTFWNTFGFKEAPSEVK